VAIIDKSAFDRLTCLSANVTKTVR
jgi:hypothetical protein